MKLNLKTALIVSGVFLFFYYGSKAVMYSARGLRNGNPGNIKEMPGDKTEWVGERATDDDPTFEEFTAPEYGIRAMGRIFRSYRDRGVLTLEQIIYEWAPPRNNAGQAENPTENYLKFVQDETGWLRIYAPQEDRGDYVDLVAAIIKFENRVNPFSNDFIAEALAIA